MTCETSCGTPGPKPYSTPTTCTEGMIRPEFIRRPKQAYALERACFEEADHVCARSLEPLYLRRECGYILPPTTYFPEYCWSTPPQRKPRSIAPDEELHIVYAGGVHPENRVDPIIASYAQYIEIGRCLAAQRIHLHIYPTPNPYRDAIFETYYDLYIDESRSNSFFHIYRPVTQTQLAATISRYDAALHIFGVGVSSAPGKNTLAKARYSTAAKLFDYIESGLPVIIHNGLHQRGIVRHFGRVVALIHVNDTREVLVDTLFSPTPDSAANCTLAAQSGRLISMYSRLRDGYHNA